MATAKNTEYVLPPSVLRSVEPVEIEVDGVKLLVRELTPTQHASIMEEFLVVSPRDGTVTLKGGFNSRLIEACVVAPPISDANVLKSGFVSKLSRELQRLMGDDPVDIKNE